MNAITWGLLGLYTVLGTGGGSVLDNPRELRFVLDDTKRIFSFALGYDTQATVTFPVVCHEAIPSNLHLIAAALETRFSRSVMISATPHAIEGSRANVTVFCEDNLTVSLEVVVTHDSRRGAQTIELVQDPEHTAREELRIQRVKKKTTADLRKKFDLSRSTWERSRESAMMRGMLAELVVEGDTETAALEGVIVKVDKQIKLGTGRGYVQFRVQNLTGKRLRIAEVSVVDDRSGNGLPGDMEFTTESGALELEHGEERRALVGFDYPDFTNTFALIVRDGAGGEVVVKDIDF